MYTILTCFYYRQVNPLPDNPAANSLSETIQNRNIRSVEVNARVAMVIWIIESVAIVCLLAWTSLFGVSGMNILMISMFWFYIIIPYTFLMNTSYNKDRVIADGWKAVLYNSWIKILFFSMQRSPNNANPGLEQNSCNSDRRRVKQRQNIDQKSKQCLNTTFQKERVFILSKIDVKKTKIKVDHFLVLEDLEQSNDMCKC